MKKGIIVLLIMALVASFAFAGTLTGSAQIDFAFNLNNTDWGLKNANGTKYTFAFEYDSTAVEVADHSTELWAEIAAEASAFIYVEEAAAPGTTPIFFEAGITKANIHIGDVTIGILNAGNAADFASSYFVKADKKPYSTVTKLAAVPAGFTVSYKGWNGGFGAEGRVKDQGATAPAYYKVFAHVETPAFKFAEDAIAVNAAAYAYAADAASQFGGSAKASYTSDDLNASVAADVAYFKAADAFVYEVAAAASYKFVSLNVYATPGALMGNTAYVGSDAKTMSLNAKLAASYKFDAVAVEGSVDARDLLIDGRAITVAAKETATFGELKVVANEKYAVADKELSVDATVTHAAEKFEAYVYAGVTFDFGASAVTEIPFEYGISTTSIVENAELSLVYSDVDFKAFSANKGTVTASAKISF